MAFEIKNSLNVTGRHPFEAFFSPRAIAVIGASRRLDAIGYKVFKALIESGFSGDLYPVNPNVSDLLGKTVYRHTRELPRGHRIGDHHCSGDSCLRDN